MARHVFLIVLLGLSFGFATASERAPEPVTLRMAAIAPEGTAWARLLGDFTEEVGRATHGQVKIKWILGGAAGDELTALERVRKNELAGLAGAIFCEHVAPSLHAIEVAGLVENDEEAVAVLKRLRAHLDEEARATPFTFLTLSTGFGHRVLFSRKPVRSLAEMRQGSNWIYDLDSVEQAQLSLMGAKLVPLPIDQAGRAYDSGRVDGFFSVPAAAVVFRYGVKARYFTDLHSMFVPACMIVSRATFNSLDGDAQRALTDAGERLAERFNRLGKLEDETLLGRAFLHQGLRAVPMNAQFQREYREAARAASARLGLVPLPLVRRVNAIVEETRAGATRTARAPPGEAGE
jgi:TRAP-type C4-dicarboxylate transport system substrate-binding protein